MFTFGGRNGIWVSARRVPAARLGLAGRRRPVRPVVARLVRPTAKFKQMTLLYFFKANIVFYSPFIKHHQDRPLICNEKETYPGSLGLVPGGIGCRESSLEPPLLGYFMFEAITNKTVFDWQCNGSAICMLCKVDIVNLLLNSSYQQKLSSG